MPIRRLINPAGLTIIKKHEKLKLKAYRSAENPKQWVIGWGHTGDDVREGMEITATEADTLLQRDLDQAEACIQRHVTAPLSDNQYSALASLVFNIGVGKFAGNSKREPSLLLKKLNARDYVGAGQEFGAWNKINGAVSGELTNRRAEEWLLFRSPVVTVPLASEAKGKGSGQT